MFSGHVERMENDRIAKRVYVGECVGSHSVGRLQKRCQWLFKEERFGCQASKENSAEQE